ncbi:MAG: hypothetical protein J7M14_07615, partial [Planctomycetes bacterium]|nr:hypothetical protein [Planctomycetota bacterium]
LELLKKIDEAFDCDDEKQLEGEDSGGGRSQAVYNIKYAVNWLLDDGGGSAHGSIWEAILALDELSQAVVDSSVLLTQANAVRFGKSSGADAAFIAPVEWRFPAKDGATRSFNDFMPLFTDHVYLLDDPERGLRDCSRIGSDLVGKLQRSSDVPWDARRVKVRGGAIPDFEWPHRLGPFARVYGWRDYGRRDEGNWWEPTWSWKRYRYWTYGPLENAIRTVRRQFGQAGWYWHSGSADTSRFAYHLRTISKVKLAYLFGLDSPQKIQYADKWILDYDEALKYHQDHRGDKPPAIMKTRYYRVAVKSTASWSDSSNWMTTYDTRVPTDTFTPKRWFSWQLDRGKDLGNAREQPLHRWVLESYGWRGMGGGWEKLTDHVWLRKRVRTNVLEDRRLRLQPRYVLDAEGNPRYEQDSDGNIVLDANGLPKKIPIPYTVYYVEWRTFGGIELRDEHEVSSFVDASHLADLPGPYLIDTDNEQITTRRYMDPETSREFEAVRVEPFTFLGVVRHKSDSIAWAQKFSSVNPGGSTFAVAQAEVFNNRSWDLWTQHWQAKLVPVEDWSGWTDEIARGITAAPVIDGVSLEEEITRAYEYMSAFPRGGPDRYLSH